MSNTKQPYKCRKCGSDCNLNDPEAGSDREIKRLCTSCYKTKQPPAELVDKYRNYLLGIEALVTQDCPEAKSFAQIAVDYSISENWEMIQSLDFAKSVIEGLKHQNRELMENQFDWKYLNEKPDDIKQQVLIQWPDGSIGISRYDYLNENYNIVWCEIKKYSPPMHFMQNNS